MRVRIVGLRAAFLLAVAALTVLAAAASGCTYSVVVQSATPSADRPGLATGTEVPIEPTGWPGGTTGAYGLRIDPSLMSNIPSIVGGNPLIEDVLVESAALDDSQYASSFSSFYVAHIGTITDLNFVQVSIAALEPDAQSEDFYTAWRDDWFKATCSQADGIGSTGVQSINDWQVDVATCTGGVDAYVLSLDNGLLVSIVDLGPRRLGKQLIQGIN
jgi:hypothetical protein